MTVMDERKIGDLVIKIFKLLYVLFAQKSSKFYCRIFALVMIKVKVENKSFHSPVIHRLLK